METPVEDAWKVLEEETGLTRADFNMTEERKEKGFWREQTETIPWLEHEEQSWKDAPRRTPVEIVATSGRGYVGSSEW